MLNESQCTSNILTCAIRTGNLEMVKYVCDHGVTPDVSRSIYNTLYISIEAMNPEIIFLIIQKGGKPLYDVFGENMFDEIKNQIIKQNINDTKIIDRVINLVLCSGATEIFKRIPMHESYISLKMNDCYNLLNHKKITI